MPRIARDPQPCGRSFLSNRYIYILCVPLLAAVSTAKRDSVWAAAALLLSLGLVEPYAVASSMQFSCCFLLALCFVTVFTADSGFADAMSSVLFRFGIGEYRAEQLSYSPIDALSRVVSTAAGKPFAILVPVIAACAALAALWGRTPRLPVYLAVACLPVAWFMVAAQPTIIHTWFQYRSVCVSYLALLLIPLDCARSRGLGRSYKKT